MYKELYTPEIIDYIAYLVLLNSYLIKRDFNI
jgi:hypothetical protein